MSSPGSETLEKIQREIQENLAKEDEWKRNSERISVCNGNGIDIQNNNSLKHNGSVPRVNGMLKKQISQNGENGSAKQQNGNKFMQNVKTKGLMHRFLKAKGKLVNNTSPVINNNIQSDKIINDFTYQPPRATTESGTLSRNGFVPAEVKMRNEVKDFQRREVELREERRKSQPELMALLNLDENDGKDEGFPEFSCSSSTSSASDLKSARSLADLCNTPEQDFETPGTHNLIKQFESLKKV